MNRLKEMQEQIGKLADIYTISNVAVSCDVDRLEEKLSMQRG